MYKFASVALTAALGVAGVAHSVPAEAHPYSPVHYAHGRYWHRDYDRDRDDHFRCRWDNDGERCWDRR
jgi:hypothetical protein